MWHLSACKISVSLSFIKMKYNMHYGDQNEIIYRISELMLPTLIQRYDKKNHFIFDPLQKRETNWNFTGCQMPHFMIKLIYYISVY